MNSKHTIDYYDTAEDAIRDQYHAGTVEFVQADTFATVIEINRDNTTIIVNLDDLARAVNAMIESRRLLRTFDGELRAK